MGQYVRMRARPGKYSYLNFGVLKICQNPACDARLKPRQHTSGIGSHGRTGEIPVQHSLIKRCRRSCLPAKRKTDWLEGRAIQGLIKKIELLARHWRHAKAKTIMFRRIIQRVRKADHASHPTKIKPRSSFTNRRKPTKADRADATSRRFGMFFV